MQRQRPLVELSYCLLSKMEYMRCEMNEGEEPLFLGSLYDLALY